MISHVTTICWLCIQMFVSLLKNTHFTINHNDDNRFFYIYIKISWLVRILVMATKKNTGKESEKNWFFFFVGNHKIVQYVIFDTTVLSILSMIVFVFLIRDHILMFYDLTMDKLFGNNHSLRSKIDAIIIIFFALTKLLLIIYKSIDWSIMIVVDVAFFSLFSPGTFTKHSFQSKYIVFVFMCVCVSVLYYHYYFPEANWKTHFEMKNEATVEWRRKKQFFSNFWTNHHHHF